MNYKKKDIAFFSIVILLLISTCFVIYVFVGSGTKEIKESKRFIGLLYSKNIITEGEGEKVISYQSEKKIDAISGKEYYIINTRDYGIDVDSDFDVIGFKNKVCKISDVKISKEEAIKLSEKYLDIIYHGDYKFKEFVEDGDKVTPYYSLVFNKYENEYQFYKDQIMVNIDKSTGKMDGYSNIATQGKPKKVNVNVEQKDAEKSALDEFLSLNNDGKIVEATTKEFCESKDKTVTELCYVITISGLDAENKETKWKYFVSTDSGEIINSAKDTVKESKA